MRFNVIILIFLIYFIEVSIYSQSKIPSESILINNNQELGEVSGFAKDTSGYIWIGTTSGLYRYDGKSFISASKLFNNENLTVFIEDVCIHDNNIWLSTHEGLYFLNLHTLSSFKIYPNIYSNKETSRYPYTSKVYFHNNELWFGSHFGIERLNIISRKITTYAIFDSLNIFVNRRYLTNGIINDNCIYFGTTNGISKINIHTGKFEWINLNTKKNKNYNSNVLTYLHLINDSVLSISTWGNGLILYDLKSKKFNNYLYEAQTRIYGVNNIVQSVQNYNKTTLIVGSVTKSIMLFDLNTKTFKPYFSTETENNQSVRFLYNDGMNLIWYTDNNGLKIQQKNNKIKFIDFNFIKENIHVTHSCEDRHNKTLYFGTMSGLIKYNYETEEIEYFNKSISGYITSMNLDDNNIYINTNNECLIFDITTAKFSKNNIIKNTYYGCEDLSDSTILFTPFFDYSYVFTKTKNKFDKLTSNDSSFIRNIAYTFIDSKKNLWIGTYRYGIGKYNYTSKRIDYKISHYNSIPIYDIYRISEDPNNNIWFISFRQGLFKYDYKEGKLENFRNFSDIQITTMYDIQKDHNSIFYISTNKGLLILNPMNMNFKIINTTDGLYHNVLDNGSLIFDNASKIVLHHVHGISIIDLKNEEDSINNQLLKINFLKVNDVNIPIYQDTSINLNYQQNELFIEPILLNYDKPNYTHYLYKLEGYHSDWNRNGTNNKIYISKIPPGKYNLKLKAIDSNNREYIYTKNISINIQSPFWKTIWFYILISVALIFTLYILYQYRITQLKKIFKVRNKIANDLHDDIGSSLSSIKMYTSILKSSSENKKLMNDIFDKIENTSQESIENISDIVWSINPKNDKLINIVTKMKAFSDNLVLPKGIKINYHIDVNNVDFFTMEVRKNLYLIYKEALNNAVKYSNTKQIDITFKKSIQNWELIVKDYGIGFNVNDESFGNGLSSMNERAEQLNGKLTIESTKNGTTIKLIFKNYH